MEESARSRWSINESTALHPHPAVYSEPSLGRVSAKEREGLELGGEVEFCVILIRTSMSGNVTVLTAASELETMGLSWSLTSRGKGGDGDCLKAVVRKEIVLFPDCTSLCSAH